MHTIRRFITLMILLGTLLFPVEILLARELAENDEQALFGEPGTGDENTLVEDVKEKTDDRSISLLSSGGVEIGGRFRFKTSSDWNFSGQGSASWPEYLDNSLPLDLGVQLFLDARPSTTLRFFGKIDLSYPFDDGEGTRTFDDVFHIKELFSDFNLANLLFFRAGKQTIHWGVGYFFSPADLLNLTAIDPEDPEAEREGPVSLKVQAAFGTTNIYLYTIFEDAENLEEIAIAPKLEFVIGDTELGFGAFFRKNNAPQAMMSLTAALGNFKLFGEGVLSYGSDRTFVVADDTQALGLTTQTYNNGFYPTGTLGIRYNFLDDLNYFNVSIIAQYMYNGQGYADADFLTRQATGIFAMAGTGMLSVSDLSYTARHYGAASINWSQMFTSDFNTGCLWIGNLADGSGMVTPFIGWNISDELNVTLKTSFRYGDSGDEYTRNGAGMTCTIAVNLGGGAF